MGVHDRDLYRACAADFENLLRAGHEHGMTIRTTDDVCTLLERLRSITIERYPASLGGHPNGLVLRGRDLCLILYERDTSPWHQQGIILHECSHIYYNHQGTEAGTAAALRVLMPDMPREQLEVVLHRAGGEEGHRLQDEWQAEAFSTVGLARLSLDQGQPHQHLANATDAVLPDDPAVAAVVRRLLEDFAGGAPS